MLMVRARAITCLVTASVALGGCSSVGKFDAAPSHEVDLSGSWALDHAASTDPQPILDKLRPKPRPDQFGGVPDDGSGIPPDTSGPPQGGGQQGGGGRRRGGGGGQQQMQYRNGRRNHASEVQSKPQEHKLAPGIDAWKDIVGRYMTQWTTHGQKATLEAEYNPG